MKRKVEILLRALLDGYRLDFGGLPNFGIEENIPVFTQVYGEGENKLNKDYVANEWSLIWFLKQAEELTDEQIIQMVAYTSLRSLRKKRNLSVQD